MIKIIIILVMSVGIGFGLTFLIANYSSTIGGSSLPYILWVLFTVISAVVLWKISNKGGLGQKSGWESPEQIRHTVVNTPQFVGRFDRDRGLLETTVRMMEADRTSHQAWFMGQPAEITIYRFRGELLDQNGSPLDYVPVEIKGRTNKWVGVLAEGDRVRVQGKMGDGLLQAKNAFNYSTNSWVGER